MKNIVTYAEEYFEYDFMQMPLTEVDSLILSNLSYYSFEGSEFENFEFSKTIQEFLYERPKEILKGLVCIEEDRKLRDVLRRGGRHGNLSAGYFVGILEVEREKQFSAVTFDLGNGEYYIAFRGTDSTVTGWREDFNLSFSKEIPAQEEAVLYAKRVMDSVKGKCYLGGHSKGGNLAVYCGAALPEAYQKRLLGVYNHDGPGFLEDFYESERYKRIRPQVRKTVPESSIIGMILEEDDNYEVIKSSENGLMQHDPFSWQVEGKNFARMEDIDNLSFYTHRALRQWLEQLNLEERERIVDTVFDVIAGTGIHEFEELTEQKRKKLRLLLESLSTVKKEDRKLVFQAMGNLLSVSGETLQQAIKTEGTVFIETYLQKRIKKLKENIEIYIENK